MARTTKDPDKRLKSRTFGAKESMWTALKTRATEEERDISSVIRDAITNYLTINKRETK